MVWESARCVGEQTNFPPSLIRNFSREVSLLVAQPEAFFHSQDLITVPACIGVASNFQLGDEQEKYTVEAPAVDTIARTLGAVPLIVPVLGKHLDVNALLELLDGLAALARCFQTP